MVTTTSITTSTTTSATTSATTSTTTSTTYSDLINSHQISTNRIHNTNPLRALQQVNMALRTQIVQYVTVGVRNAVRRTHLTPPKKSAFVDIFSGSFSSKKDKAVVPGLEVLEFLLDGIIITFTAFFLFLFYCYSSLLQLCHLFLI